MNLKKIIAIGAVAASTIVAVAPAHAVVETFAAFNASGSGTNVRWVVSSNNNGGNFSKNATFYSTAAANSTVAGSRNVNFSLLQAAIAPFATNLTAVFTLGGTVTNTIATLNGTNIIQSNVNGSFSFISTNAITIGATTFAAGSNLLSGTFTNTTISGARNGTSAGWSGSTPSSAITYTSDFLTFTPGSNYDLGWNLTSINPLINATPTAGTPTTALRSFRAVIGGSFSSDPAPLTPAIPEPASWMLMIAGFGMVGVSARRRSRRASVAA